jgi:hypothetical protein
MPKKTKKQKLVSEYRRKIDQLDTPRPAFADERKTANPDTAPTGVSYSIPAKGSEKRTETLPVFDEKRTAEFVAIRRDLVQTLILVGGMLAVELTIWRILG